ncbi:hypothetical protein HER10_EVM0001994 [Colletotrichum scovillei]|uniref:uncharacterized protein n=1 Tax=Colletotrichum scovillei TaxID=1209932 RepID=UPI0015C3B74D|nr:uncharacterized protein HER10_EVM0001994 [Colletotrichum scovillei]KAF4783934.1 hypothetical protein HER10_EVM0001994 [Colletotrichum scovillei]
MKPTTTYSKLNQREEESSWISDDKESEDLETRSSRWTRLCAYALSIVLGGMTCGVLGYILLNLSTLRTSPSTSELHCGNSSTEARALGCVFDLLTNNWMPEYCSDPATDSEYRTWVMEPQRHLGAWAFYYDKNAEHQVASEEELSNLVGRHVYTTTENHLAHCTFVARRMHRLAIGEITAVAHNTFAHTMHCTSAILDAISTPEHHSAHHAGSTFDVGIVSCAV